LKIIVSRMCGFLAILVGADTRPCEAADSRSDHCALAAFDGVAAAEQPGDGANARPDQCARARAVGIVRVAGLSGVGRAAGKQDCRRGGGDNGGSSECSHRASPHR